jgi:Domain of unknown function (DUF4249)
MPSVKTHIYFFVLLLTTCLAACRQAYNPPAITAANNYFVADGFINTGSNAVTTFNLNRSRNLGDSIITGIPELNAVASIVSSSGASYPLTDTANTGIYSSAPLNLDITQQYSIAITTSDGQKYSSDPVPCKQTPPIDSLSWQQPYDLIIYVNTHDPTGNTRYYRYDYQATWEHDAELSSPWIAVNGILQAADSTNQKAQCWTTASSTNILLATSAALAQDIIVAFPLETIPNGDARLVIGYSILVKQYALTKDAYNYWLLIQKTSQQLGTLFDIQPTQLIGNIHCLTNPSAPVIGFISASSVQQQRINIYISSLNDNWMHNSPAVNCQTIEIGYNANDFPAFSYPDTSYGPYYFNGPDSLVLAPNFCTNCLYFGGTTTKPSFWP